MSALELVARLRDAGIRISVQEGKIRLKAGKGALTDELKQEVIANKQEIVALLSSDSEALPPPLPVDRSNRSEFPLSYAQQRLWFLDELEPGTPVYNMPFAVRVKGPLQIDALQAALNDLARQHESLRTVFSATDNEPVQCVKQDTNLQVLVENLEDSSEQDILERMQTLAKVSFDLAAGPLLQLTVLRTGATEHILFLVMHHIISDLWSLDIFFRDLGRWYEKHTADVAPGPDKLPLQYADYATWQRDVLSGTQLRKHLDYWLPQLSDAPPVLELATDHPRPSEPGYHGKWSAIVLSGELDGKLRALARASGSTMFMLTLAAFTALLHKYSGEDDIVVGTPISGRQHSEVENLIGFFLNTLAIRTQLSADMSFRQLLDQTRTTALAAYAHQDLPFEKLVEELQPERNMSHTPVFQHMFIWQDQAPAAPDIPGLQTEPASLISHDTAKFDLTLAMTGHDNGIEAGIEYNTDLFDNSTIDRMLGHLTMLLTAVAENPEIAIGAIQLMDATERRVITEDFNATQADMGPTCRVQDLIDQQVAKAASRVAVEMGDAQLSYAELDRRTNLLATKLQELGAAPGSMVAISCERSLELPVAALAVVKTGACYVPVDPHYPQDRIAAMLADSQATIVLTQSSIDLAATTAKRIDLDTFIFDAEAPPLVSDFPASNALYCIYTSGSTGKPKGVQLSHAGLSNLLRWQIQHERLGTAARTLQFASLSFDVSFQEMFSTWSTGGTLVMIDEELRRDLPRLAEFINTASIERLYLPYAALQPIAETLLNAAEPPALQDIVVAGEALQVSPEIRDLFEKLPGAALHNQYGPSETHVVTALTLSGAAQEWPALPSIGTPVANTHAYVLDNNLQPTPIGVPGELYLGGVQVALGYLGRPDLNQEKFVASPFKPEERLYRTGDRVRFAADGNLEFLGRVDDQFKWRGFRIEPGEIETRLTAEPAIQQAVVVLRDDAPGGNRQLVAYLTGVDIDLQSTKARLQEELPEYMVPPVFAILDELPLTPSGKVARRRLPPPEYSRDDAVPYVAPRTPTETSLTSIWSEILGLEQVGVHDDFFALGGHSLLATQLVSRIRDQLNVALPLKYVFRYPSPASLAETIMTLQATLESRETPDDDDREEFRI